MKGIVLAGGRGTRLRPMTRVLNKHLLPVYDRPMIYYPLEMLAQAGVREVLVVTGGNQIGAFPRLLGDGSELGLRRLEFAVQKEERGIADAVALCEGFAAGGPVCVVLGDTVLERGIRGPLERFVAGGEGAKVLLQPVEEPSEFGIAEIVDGRVARIEEKPLSPPSNLAVIGVYMYDPHVFDIIRTLEPSERGELEITDVNNRYAAEGRLAHELLEGWWVDAGTVEGLHRAATLVAGARNGRARTTSAAAQGE